MGIGGIKPSDDKPPYSTMSIRPIPCVPKERGSIRREMGGKARGLRPGDE